MEKGQAHTLLTLSTHDTKRSADVRARINVLTELPTAWAQAVARWADANQGYKRRAWPDRNDEYLLYQTLVGAWPIDAGRLASYMEKATREAKVHTSWVHPDHEYETAVAGFVAAALADEDFLADVGDFLAEHRIIERGRVNSLGPDDTAAHLPGIVDDSAVPILESLGREVEALAAETGRPLFVIAESDLNDPRFVRSRDAGGMGLDAAWADEWHHALHATLTREKSGYYEDFGPVSLLAKALRQAWVYDGTFSAYRDRVHGRRPDGLGGNRFVVFTQNHDQVGNRARGERSIAL